LIALMGGGSILLWMSPSGSNPLTWIFALQAVVFGAQAVYFPKLRQRQRETARINGWPEQREPHL
jgi:hypothetical protein